MSNYKAEAVMKEQRRAVDVGDGVTLCLYTDRQAFTVIRKTKCAIVIQRDKATLANGFKPEFVTGGFSAHCVNQDDQEWVYERDPNGEIHTCRWSEVKGRYTYNGCNIINGRHEYYDWNF